MYIKYSDKGNIKFNKNIIIFFTTDQNMIDF